MAIVEIQRTAYWGFNGRVLQRPFGDTHIPSTVGPLRTTVGNWEIPKSDAALSGRKGRENGEEVLGLVRGYLVGLLDLVREGCSYESLSSNGFGSSRTPWENYTYFWYLLRGF